MKRLTKGLIVMVLGLIVLVSSCKVSDIQTDYMKDTVNKEEQLEEKGKALLKEAWLAHGFDKLKTHETYQVEATDHWKGALGKMGNLWGDSNKKPITLRFAVGTFDNQVEFKEGKLAGQVAGLQSWKYYEKENSDSKAEFQKTNKRIGFGLAAYHYFFELGDRIMNAPIIRYAGEKEFEGNKYDIIFATWESVEANRDYDQYRIWVNKETKLIDFANYTIRENYLPGAKMFYGSIRYGDMRTIDGVKISFQQEVYLNKPKAVGKYLHKLTLTDFKFDAFSKSDLYPDANIKPIGDDKPSSKVLSN